MPTLNAENNQSVLFFKLSHFLQADPAHFYKPWMLLRRLFSRHPFLFGDHLIWALFSYLIYEVWMCILYSRTTTVGGGLKYLSYFSPWFLPGEMESNLIFFSKGVGEKPTTWQQVYPSTDQTLRMENQLMEIAFRNRGHRETEASKFGDALELSFWSSVESDWLIF